MKDRTQEYTTAIREMIKTEGIEITNMANHKALETGLINLEQFQAAARIIAKEFLSK